MAKCSVCGLRKGKRPCCLCAYLVCPLCCASIRQESKCGTCAFYQPPQRNYSDLPRYSTAEMEDSEHLQEIAFPIESAVCSLDRTCGFKLTDAEAIEIFELLLDLYAFGDREEAVSARTCSLGCQEVIDLLRRELRTFDRDEIVKVLGVVRFVAKRRACGGRHHLDVLHQYCGAFVTKGVGLRRLSDGTDLLFGAL
ncbi:MAG: hypothetical protein ACE15E_18135 [Acidobacteriota bacterium]